jgi:hypothetical protein
MSCSMIDSLLTNEVQEYEDNNNYIREKLKFIISKNTKYNLRELSRYLNKNDAYLQQYLYRRTPKILPEEYRYKLSNILEIDVEELSPKWTKDYSNKTEQVSIKNVEKDNLSKTQSISFSKHLLNDLDLSKLESLFFFQLTTDQCTVTNIIDININSYKEPGLYLLNDKNIYFLVYLDVNDQDSNKISVKPYLKTFSPFHIVKDALNISARVIWQSSKIFLK